MDARWIRATILMVAASSLGASHRTENFIVEAPTPQLAREFAEAAESYRSKLAVEWIGHELPRWGQPCPISCEVGPQLGAGGATSFMFDRGRSGKMEAFGWRMTVQGSRERILDSVLPHEVTHTIFATHFRRALPRWADEGACTTVEDISERTKQHRMLITFLKTGQGIAFDRMFAMKEYPANVMPLYSQGYSTVRFLLAQGGQRKFIQFMEDGFAAEDFQASVKKHYGYANLGELQNKWLDWVRVGSPREVPGNLRSSTTLLASNEQPAADRPRPNLIYRGQNDPVRQASAEQPSRERLAVAESRGDSDRWHARDAAAPSRYDRLAPEAERPEAHQAVRPQPVEPARQIILQRENDSQGVILDARGPASGVMRR